MKQIFTIPPNKITRDPQPSGMETNLISPNQPLILRYTTILRVHSPPINDKVKAKPLVYVALNLKTTSHSTLILALANTTNLGTILLVPIQFDRGRNHHGFQTFLMNLYFLICQAQEPTTIIK